MYSLPAKEQFVGVMVVKSAHVIVLGVFCVFYLDHFFRGIEVVVHGGSFVAHGSGTCMRMDGTVLIRQIHPEFCYGVIRSIFLKYYK